MAFVIAGLVTGVTYGLLAVGLVLVFRSTNILNFAHGSIGALGAYIFVEFTNNMGLPTGVALALSLAAAAVFGALLYLGVLNRIAATSILAATVATIILAGLIESFIAFVWGDGPQFVHLLFPMGAVRLWDTNITYAQIGTVAVAVVGAAVLALWLGKALLGLSLRALSDNATGLRALGVSPLRLGAFTWALACVLATLAAILLAPSLLLLPGTLQSPLAKAFGAALIGGLRNAPVALIGGLTIGVFEGVLAANVEAASVREASVFILILVLLFALRRHIVGAFAFTEGEARA